MPTGLRRYHQQGHQHFLTISCDHKSKYFDTAPARDIFENSLERSRDKYNFTILAYVVMPNHVHLLVSEPPDVLLSVAIQSLKIGVAKRLPHKPFWNRRYYDFNVYTEGKWAEKIAYIHRNPVKWGLVERPEDWPWSSAPHLQDVPVPDCPAGILLPGQPLPR